MAAREARLLATILIGLVATGCVSLQRTPEARFFVLRPVLEPGAGDSDPRTGAVGVLPVSLPGHLDRPQVVTQADDHEVRIDEFVRWAEPLGPALTRILAENLAAALPDRLVLLSPWPARTELRCRVVVELEAFAPHTNGEVRLAGRWALLGDEGDARPLTLQRLDLRGGPVPVGADGIVDARAGAAAMSALLGELSRQISAAIEELPEPIDEQTLDSEPVPGS